MTSAVPTTGPTAQVPAAQLAQLEALASQGLLSGVDPAILAAQDQAESSGHGGGVNSSGYGGFFGLAANTPYGPTGAQVTKAELTATTPAAFAAQAQTAAAEDAALLTAYGGNTVKMEQAYQGGGSEGTAVFAQDHIPTSDPVGGVQTTLSVSSVASAVGGAVGGAIGSAASAAGTAVVSALGPLLLKVVFVVGALALIVLGVSRMFPGVTRTVTSTAKTAATAAAE